MKKFNTLLTYVSSNRIWLITLGCLDLFFRSWQPLTAVRSHTPLAFSDDGLIHGYMGALTRGHFHTTGIRLCRPALTESAEKRHQFYCVYELR